MIPYSLSIPNKLILQRPFLLNLITKTHAQCWWLMPVIIAPWEDKIMKITIQGQPGQNSMEDHISMKERKLDMVACTCHPNDSKKHKTGGIWSRPDLQKVRPYHQNNQSKKGLRYVLSSSMLA
jgi:hypothetical protein